MHAQARGYQTRDLPFPGVPPWLRDTLCAFSLVEERAPSFECSFVSSGVFCPGSSSLPDAAREISFLEPGFRERGRRVPPVIIASKEAQAADTQTARARTDRIKRHVHSFFRFRGMHVDKSYLVREDQAAAGPSNEQNHRDGVCAKDISTIGTKILFRGEELLSFFCLGDCDCILGRFRWRPL